MMDFDKLFVTRNWVGKPVRRNEDVKFVKGEAQYVDDLDMDCAHVAILRSIFAHARIKKIDTSRAEALKGVPILARCAGLIGHLTEELSKPIGFALSYQATREQRYTGELPPGFTPKTSV